MPRRRGTAIAGATAAVASLAVLLRVLWNLLDPGPLHRIVVTNAVYGNSGYWQIEIDDANRYVYVHAAVEDRGAIPFAPFAARLASVAELRLLPNAASNGNPGLTFWVEGRRRTVTPFLLGDGGDHAALRAFATALHDEVARDVLRRNAPLIGALTSLRDLRAVQAVSKGCFGTCGAYTITLRSDATATLDWPDYPRAVQHRARHIDWNQVRTLLHGAHVERLQRKYPSRALDTQSASLRFTFSHFEYTVDAPDSNSWPTEFSDAFRELRRFAAASTWSPPLSPYETERLTR
jgi:hypothetical protein